MNIKKYKKKLLLEKVDNDTLDMYYFCKQLVKGLSLEIPPRFLYEEGQKKKDYNKRK